MKVLRSYPLFLLVVIGIFAFLSPFIATTSSARSKTPQEINTQVDEALRRFSEKMTDAPDLLRSAKGVLVIPNVFKAGVGLGGIYGEGALLVNGKPIAYYNIAGGFMGLDIGAAKRDLVILFMENRALENFRTNSNWTASLTQAMTLMDGGKEGYASTQVMNKPVIAFVFGQRGIMLDASIEGTKFSRMDKSSEMAMR